MKLSVIIPVYNEAKSISILLDRVIHAPLPQGWGLQIVVVNDGSTDATDLELIKFKQVANLLVIRQSQNLGKTAAVALGIKNATGDYVLIQDADLEYDPVHFPELLSPIISGQARIVFGSRWLGSIQNMKWINRAANRISTWTMNCLCKTHLTDIFTCYKLFPKALFEKINIQSQDFQFDSEAPVKAIKLGYEIFEIPIRYVARSRNEGKKINWRRAIVMYWGLWYYRFFDAK